MVVMFGALTSHLTYGCNVWGLTSTLPMVVMFGALTSEVNLKKIELLQKKCLRIVLFSGFGCHTNNLFIQHKILKVREIITLSNATCV